jgi:2-polyprenyl-3-methyl-5-hydroxy-6-metoxy-1,4-benzoquinol methylase
MKRNNELKSKWKWGKRAWKQRAREIAGIIPIGASILDVGGGWGYIHDLLPNNEYRSIDTEEWTDATIKADFNKGEFPDIGTFDIIIIQGLMEYINDPEGFLEKIKKYGNRMIISYNIDQNKIERKNKITFQKFDDILEKTHWIKLSEKKLRPWEKLYLCAKDENTCNHNQISLPR